MFTGLSYPHMAPPLDWLMVQLLFYDEIKTIVPETEINQLPERHRQFYDAVAGAVSFVDPENEQIWASKHETDRLIKGFEIIRKNTQFDGDRLKVVIDKKTSSQRIANCEFLHVAKTSPEICAVLEKLKLMPRVSEEIAIFFTDRGGWLVVEENSVNLLMGHLSNSISKQHGYYPITYDSMSFIVNSLNDLEASIVSDSQTMLATAVLKLEFPYDLSAIDIDKYLNIRSAYADIRQPFHAVIKNLAEMNRIDDIKNQSALEEKVRSVVSEFDNSYMKFKKAAPFKNIREWVPFTASGILTFLGCAALTFPWNLVLTGGSLTVATIDKVLASQKSNGETDLFNRLSSFEKDIIEKASIKSLL